MANNWPVPGRIKTSRFGKSPPARSLPRSLANQGRPKGSARWPFPRTARNSSKYAACSSASAMVRRVRSPCGTWPQPRKSGPSPWPCWRAPVAFTVDEKQVLLGGAANPFLLLNAADGKEVRLWGGHKAAVTGVALSPDGKTLFTGSADRTIKCWDAVSPVRVTPNGRPPASQKPARLRPPRPYATSGPHGRTSPSRRTTRFWSCGPVIMKPWTTCWS